VQDAELRLFSVDGSDETAGGAEEDAFLVRGYGERGYGIFSGDIEGGDERAVGGVGAEDATVWRMSGNGSGIRVMLNRPKNKDFPRGERDRTPNWDTYFTLICPVDIVRWRR